MRKHSFTLIEMLIVVVIIGILAAALIPRLQSVQARARDTKRKADLHQVATALEIYREDNGNFKEFARRDNCNLTHYIINPGQYSSIMRGDPTDMQDNTWFAYQVLSKYMTTVPSDSDVSPRQSDGCTPIYGYYMSVLNKNGQNCNSATCTANHFVLNARMENAGSSNRVTNLYNLNNYDICDNNGNTNRCPTTGSNGRIGAVGSFQDNRRTSSTLYQSFICTRVTDSGDTINDGNGNCRVDPNNTSRGGGVGNRKNGGVGDGRGSSEYRYIYTN